MTEQEKKSIYSAAYHWRYEDNMPWKFVAGMVNQDLGEKYTVDQVKKICEEMKKSRQKQ